MTIADPGFGAFEAMLTACLLVLLRISAFVTFAPFFQSPAIPAKVKAVFCFAIAVLVGPVAAQLPGAHPELSVAGALGEVMIGLSLGLTLSFLTESVLFAASLMSASFSFSLANLLDPNSQVETEVLGAALNWLNLLVLLSAGLHRTLLAAVLRSLATVPLGSAIHHAHSAEAILTLSSGIFVSGLQLAAPVIAAALLIEVAVGLVGRMAPMMPAQVMSVPLKTITSYVVLIGTLALWPGWIEHRFGTLLDSAQRVIRP